MSFIICFFIFVSSCGELNEELTILYIEIFMIFNVVMGDIEIFCLR